MDIIGNLNTLATIGTFGCISFALSGIGVRLGKFGNSPQKLGFKYISETDGEDKANKLYEATAKINKNINNNAPDWAKDQDQLKKWCNKYEKFTRKLSEGSQYCLLRNIVWHKLIANDLAVNDQKISETGEGEKCTYEILNKYADGENASYLIGKKLCTNSNETNNQSTTSQSPQQR